MKRLDQFLSKLKYGSRTEVEKLIKDKKVIVNEKIAENGKMKIDPLKASVFVLGQKVYYRESIHLMINKPKGYLSSNIDEKYPSVMNLLEDKYKRYDFKIAGRLDWDSEGLLLLTTEGRLVHQITHPTKNKEKVYYVELDRPYDDKNSLGLLEGIYIKDGNNETYFAKATQVTVNGQGVLIGITEGKFHQVKRMFEYYGYKVEKLKRIKIGNLLLGDLEEGKTKEIDFNDIL